MVIGGERYLIPADRSARLDRAGALRALIAVVAAVCVKCHDIVVRPAGVQRDVSGNTNGAPPVHRILRAVLIIIPRGQNLMRVVMLYIPVSVDIVAFTGGVSDRRLHFLVVVKIISAVEIKGDSAAFIPLGIQRHIFFGDIFSGVDLIADAILIKIPAAESELGIGMMRIRGIHDRAAFGDLYACDIFVLIIEITAVGVEFYPVARRPLGIKRHIGLRKIIPDLDTVSVALGSQIPTVKGEAVIIDLGMRNHLKIRTGTDLIGEDGFVVFVWEISAVGVKSDDQHIRITRVERDVALGRVFGDAIVWYGAVCTIFIQEPSVKELPGNAIKIAIASRALAANDEHGHCLRARIVPGICSAI